MKTENLQSLVRAGFIWHIEHVRAGVVIDRETVHNIIPDEGLKHMGGVTFKSATQVPTWYLAPYEGNYNPDHAATAATIVAASTECTAYDEAARQEWVEGTLDLNMDNSASKAEFTMNATKAVYGGFLISSSAKGAVTGVLMSLVRFASPKNCTAGDTLRIVAGIGFATA